MASRLSRVFIFAAASAATLGLFAMVRAAPAQPTHHARAAYAVAATDRRASSDTLAEDAAAAGQTGRAPLEPPRREQAAPTDPADPIGAMITSRGEPAPDSEPYDLPYPPTDAARPVHRQQMPPRRHHLMAAAPHVAARRAQPLPPAALPHRRSIVIEAPPHPALSPEPAPPPVEDTLPQVQAEQAPADLDAQVAALTDGAAADMAESRFELSPDLAAGHEGAVVVRLPGRVLAALRSKAEDSGFGSAARTLSITVALSARGYAVMPDEALTTEVEPGRPVVFSWRVNPSGASGGTLSATMTASMQVDGEAVNVPLGVLTAQIPPPPVQAPSSMAAAPAPAPAPAPELGTRLRAQIARLALPDLSHLRLPALSIPGRPTVDLPVLGEVASGNLVAAGLLLLALLFLRSLLRDSSLRAERRRRFEAFDRGYFGDELR